MQPRCQQQPCGSLLARLDECNPDYCWHSSENATQIPSNGRAAYIEFLLWVAVLDGPEQGQRDGHRIAADPAVLDRRRHDDAEEEPCQTYPQIRPKHAKIWSKFPKFQPEFRTDRGEGQEARDAGVVVGDETHRLDRRGAAHKYDELNRIKSHIKSQIKSDEMREFVPHRLLQRRVRLPTPRTPQLS